MLNYLSSDRANEHLSTDPANVFRLAQFRGRSLTYTNECPEDYEGWSGFQILNGSTPFQEWVRRPYDKDDLLIVPYGELAPDTILYRGASIFAHRWQIKLLNFPQLTFKDVGHVERKLYNLVEHRQTIGWRIFQVTSAAPVALIRQRMAGWLTVKRYSTSVRFFGYKQQPVAPSLAMIQPKLLETLIIPRSSGSFFGQVWDPVNFIELPLVNLLRSTPDSKYSRVHERYVILKGAKLSIFAKNLTKGIPATSSAHCIPLILRKSLLKTISGNSSPLALHPFECGRPQG